MVLGVGGGEIIEFLTKVDIRRAGLQFGNAVELALI